MSDSPRPPTRQNVPDVSPARRSRWSVALEVLLWALFAVAVGVGMIMLSERLLPANF